MAKSKTSKVTKPLPTSSIFALIHDLHQTITSSIDTSLTWDQLNSPAVNYSLIRPIIDRLDPENPPKTAVNKAADVPGAKTASGLLNLPTGGEGSHDGNESALDVGKRETCLGAVLFALMANR